MRTFTLCSAILALAAIAAPVIAVDTPNTASASKLGSVQVTDLTGKTISVPDQRAKATVLLFVSTTCPYSNEAAPTMAAVADKYAKLGFDFVYVYGNTYETKTKTASHARAYGFDAPAVLDTKQELVRAAGATNTPEAVVISPSGRMLYRGRIDNQFEEVGVQRTNITQHDLADALDAIAVGKAPAHSFERPIGCSIHLTR